MAEKKKAGFNYRSSESGRFVKKEKADKAPAKHEKERRK